jgi:hypothetical protein
MSHNLGSVSIAALMCERTAGHSAVRKTARARTRCWSRSPTSPRRACRRTRRGVPCATLRQPQTSKGPVVEAHRNGLTTEDHAACGPEFGKLPLHGRRMPRRDSAQTPLSSPVDNGQSRDSALGLGIPTSSGRLCRCQALQPLTSAGVPGYPGTQPRASLSRPGGRRYGGRPRRPRRP